MTSREKDEKATWVVNDFLDKYIYPRFVTNLQRICDTSMQARGVDVMFTYKGGRYKCDEKAAIKYIGKNLQTFNLELRTTQQSGRRSDGWFLDEHYITDSYLFVWVDDAEVDWYDLVSPDQITRAEVVLVEYEDIWNYLEGLGWDIDRLIDKADALEQDENEPREEDSLRFSYNPGKMREDPICVLLTREVLRNISKYNYKYNAK